ncbi:VOC family protein [Nocardia beijingensis]|uniref:VOC family protein n=1 Tax=Nocardia beijingensis TaxID=95162 RepID=UPI001895AB6A|nr:VOC family protein [Nocardia beijingensis]MBF6077942.1 glyoxalase/bleomycin resistance/extradiol dioxygenase family protein [Nocardia beijingensis]
MDALHPRLLVTRFTECFEFYAAVLPELIGATPANGTAAGPYANWDVGDEGVLALFDRSAMAEVVGTTALPAAPAQDAVMFVCRVPDVDAGAKLCTDHGATVVAAPADRPHWGPGLRTAHLRDPEGTLIELQSY